MVFPNLEGMKQLKGMTDSDMASVIGVSRQTFLTKKMNGRFYPWECRKYVDFFGKSFQYLFATTNDPECN